MSLEYDDSTTSYLKSLVDMDDDLSDLRYFACIDSTFSQRLTSSSTPLGEPKWDDLKVDAPMVLFADSAWPISFDDPIPEDEYGWIPFISLPFLTQSLF